MIQTCGTCRHWTQNWVCDDDEPDALGTCHAMDDVPLPHAWRWCSREVVSVQRQEGTDCPAYQPKET